MTSIYIYIYNYIIWNWNISNLTLYYVLHSQKFLTKFTLTTYVFLDGEKYFYGVIALARTVKVIQRANCALDKTCKLALDKIWKKSYWCIAWCWTTFLWTPRPCLQQWRRYSAPNALERKCAFLFKISIKIIQMYFLTLNNIWMSTRALTLMDNEMQRGNRRRELLHF